MTRIRMNCTAPIQEFRPEAAERQRPDAGSCRRFSRATIIQLNCRMQVHGLTGHYINALAESGFFAVANFNRISPRTQMHCVDIFDDARERAIHEHFGIF
jgi:hypothetical protein